MFDYIPLLKYYILDKKYRKSINEMAKELSFFCYLV